jgi:hypothetical protein
VAPISVATSLRDRWKELRWRWKIPPTVIARARNRCEVRLPDVCTHWGKEFHEIVSPPRDIEEIILVCSPCGKFLRDNPEWATAKGLKKSAT